MGPDQVQRPHEETAEPGLNPASATSSLSKLLCGSGPPFPHPLSGKLTHVFWIILRIK